MKKLLIFIIIFICPLFFSGCFLLKSPNELLAKPTTYIYGKNAENVMDFIDKNDKSLTLALGDTDKRSIREVDLDNDNNPELLILYKKEADYFNYGILVLKQNNMKYEILNNITFSAKGIDKVILKDLTGDNKPEILIGIKTSEKNKNTLYVYSYERDFFECIYDSNYIDFYAEKLTNDNLNFLIITKENDKVEKDLSKTNLKSLEVYEFVGIKNQLVDSVTFARPVTDICLKVGKASKNHTGIFTTLNVDNSLVYIDIFLLKDRSLIDIFQNESNSKELKEIKNASFFKSADNITNLNSSYNQLNSFVEDVNNDNIYDIKVIKSCSIKENIEIPFNINYWYNWDGNSGFNLCLRNFINEKYDYSLNIPNSLSDNLIILQNLKETGVINRTDFFLYNCSNADNLLFSLKVYSTQSWDSINKNIKEDYSVLYNNKNTTYVIFLNNKLCNKFNLNYIYIQNSLFNYLR